MDNRWITILVILIFGLCCMFLIEQSSTTVGSAVTIVNDVSITLPHGFKIADSEVNFAILLDESTGEKILVKYLRDGNNSMKEYKKEIKAMNDNEDLEIIKNESYKTVHKIYCKNLAKDDEYLLAYFDAFDRTMLIKMENYDNKEKQETDLGDILDTMQPDYKQNRD